MTRRQSKDRRLGWRPPSQIQVSIAVETYEYIKGIAVTKNQRSAPFYDTLQSIIREFEEQKAKGVNDSWELEEDLAFTKNFLAVAMDEKRQLEKENNEMKEQLSKVISIN